MLLAVEVWNRSLASVGCDPITLDIPVTIYTPEEWPYGALVVGWYTGHSISVRDTALETPSHAIDGTIMHEIGHHMGLGHSTATNSIMQAQQKWNVWHPSREDALAVCGY